MSYYGHLSDAIKQEKIKEYERTITIGEVVDTNDPQQMGRIRVYCAAYGDSQDLPLSQVPWAIYAAPFAGANDIGTRGRGEDQSTGPVAYGMWNIPKVGSYVLVGCLDGNPNYRFWFAAIYPQFLTHTMPHGRYSYSGQAGAGKPTGPLTSTEDPILPLYNNMKEAFTNSTVGVDPQQSFEFRTRGADNQVSHVDNDYIGTPKVCDVSSVADDRNIVYTEKDGRKILVNQGYGKSRVQPDLRFTETDNRNWDPQTYSWTTPGFHAISMSDRADNCRVRIRTTGGHQIIMDDTNERIYISTAQGKTWVELDEKGNIDVFAEGEFSVRAKGDINMKTDKAFRVTADGGVHLNSNDEVRIRGHKDVHIRSGATLRLRSVEETRIDSQLNLHVITNGVGMITATGDLNLSTGGDLKLSANPNIYMNGPVARLAEQAEEKEAFAVSRMPDHEPYARVYSKPENADQDSNNTFVPEYQYDDAKVGRGSEARGYDFKRNPRWHR